jgi:hypothetical protein
MMDAQIVKLIKIIYVYKYLININIKILILQMFINIKNIENHIVQIVYKIILILIIILLKIKNVI